MKGQWAFAPSRSASSSVMLLVAAAVAFAVTAHPAFGEVAKGVPKASCGRNDRTESVQGQTTLAERFSPSPAKAYNCNLELIGQFEGEGASADLETFDTCAYFSTASLSPNLEMKHPGVVVLDVADVRNPKAVKYLDSPAMLGAQESMEINQTRKLLIASTVPDVFDIYDLSKDCRAPVLIRSLSVSGLVSHGGQFAPDGLILPRFSGHPDKRVNIAI